jgi:multidrug efflux pump subunit AcrA (membrane-fusion protein)
MTPRPSRIRTRLPNPLWRAALALLLLTPGPSTSAQPPAPAVTVAHPERREVVDWDEYTGRFEAVEHVDIRARVAGYLESVHFRDGQLVKQGDLLFTIDPRPFEAAVARAEANLDRAKTQLALAGLELNRAERLVKKSMMSHEETDTRRTNRAATAAEVAAAEAELRTARLELGYARITAPISGRVSRRRIDVGNLIKVSSSTRRKRSISSSRDDTARTAHRAPATARPRSNCA